MKEKVLNMGSIDGEIPAVWFLISSIGFVILTFINIETLAKASIRYFCL